VQCRRLAGLRVYPHSEAAWVDEWGRRVYGLAYCDTGTIMMGSGQALRATSYTHEVIHWLQACRTSVDHGARLVDGEGYHANWGADGIWVLIDSVKRGQ
jgi:hypothetical protein